MTASVFSFLLSQLLTFASFIHQSISQFLKLFQWKLQQTSPSSLADIKALLLHTSTTKPFPSHISLSLSNDHNHSHLAQWTLWACAAGSTHVSIHCPHLQISRDSFMSEFEAKAASLSINVLSRNDSGHGCIIKLELSKPREFRNDDDTNDEEEAGDEQSIDSGFGGTLSNEGSEIDHQQQPLLSHEAAETEQIQRQHDLSENAAEIFTFTIRFIDARWDGKSDLVRVAKLLAQKALDFKRSSSDEKARFSDSIDVKMIDSLLLSTDFPEPELMYVFGGKLDALTLDSYPPWETRLVEICHVKEKLYHTPDYKDFADGVFMYSKCEKRVGK